MSRGEGDHRTPRAMVHKRILDAAKEHPEASMQELAADIAGAPADLVEQVLDEYGDPVQDSDAPMVEEPADDQPESPPSPDQSSESTARTDLDELSDKQQETLRAIRKRLSATQAEIGEVLGVSGATISNRLSDIEGFDWENRDAFVSELLEPQIIGDGNGQLDGELHSELERRLTSLEDQLKSVEFESGEELLPPELTHKVLHACLKSDQISEDEELEIIQALM